MTSRLDVESAIMDAEGASAVLSILQLELTSSTVDGWKSLGLKPQDDLHVITMTPTEYRAIHHAMNSLQLAVTDIAKVFYAHMKERAHD